MFRSWLSESEVSSYKIHEIATILALDIREVITGDALSQIVIDLSAVAEYGNFKVGIYWSTDNIENREMWSDAHLSGFGSKLSITYDPRLRDVEGNKHEEDYQAMLAKGRFLICHEMAHSFTLRSENNPLCSLIRSDDWMRSPTSDEEYFCDIFSASLLLPPPLLGTTKFRKFSDSAISLDFSVPTNVVTWMRTNFDRKLYETNWKFLPEKLPLL